MPFSTFFENHCSLALLARKLSVLNLKLEEKLVELSMIYKSFIEICSLIQRTFKAFQSSTGFIESNDSQHEKG